MASILTNVSAMTALQTLQSVSTNLLQTQDRISTGMRVAKAKDNAAYWAIATTMRTDASGFSAITDSLGLGLSIASTASTVNQKITDLLKGMKDQIVLGLTEGLDRDKINDVLVQNKQQIENAIATASFNGTNWLDGSVNDRADTNGPTNILAGLVRSGSTVTPEYIVFDPGETHYSDGAGAGWFYESLSGAAAGPNGVAAGGILDAAFVFDNATTTQADMEDALAEVEAAIAKATEVGSLLGSIEQRLEDQKTFMSQLIDATERGIGVLVDADLNQESARLKALQVQQQLAIEALNIANAEPQNILALFR